MTDPKAPRKETTTYTVMLTDETIETVTVLKGEITREKAVALAEINEKYIGSQWSSDDGDEFELAFGSEPFGSDIIEMGEDH